MDLKQRDSKQLSLKDMGLKQMSLKSLKYFFFKCLLIGGRIPKQSNSLSSPREMAGDVELDELDWDKTVFRSWLCIMSCTICRYSSSVRVEARRAVI